MLFPLLVLFLAFRHPASATIFGPVFAREGGTPALAFPEPLIFHDLTMEEFHVKVLEYRGTSLKRTASDAAEDPAHNGTLTVHRLGKRIPFRGEQNNNAEQQVVVDARNSDCHDKHGENYRFASGNCKNNQMTFYCNLLVGGARNTKKTMRRKCIGTKEEPETCRVIRVQNYKYHEVLAPWCAEFINVANKEKEVDFIPTYEGQKSLPDKEWTSGTIDTFWQLSGPYEGLTGHYDYRGHFASGKTFESQSPKQANSWACLGCPAGVLYLATIGFKAQAFGLTVSSGSWF